MIVNFESGAFNHSATLPLVPCKIVKHLFRTLPREGQADSRGLKTSQILLPNCVWADLEKQERQRAEHQTAVADGTMAFADTLAIYKQRLGRGCLFEAAQQSEDPPQHKLPASFPPEVLAA